MFRYYILWFIPFFLILSGSLYRLQGTIIEDDFLVHYRTEVVLIGLLLCMLPFLCRWGLVYLFERRYFVSFYYLLALASAVFIILDEIFMICGYKISF